jgi:hypothetical protein
MTGQEDSTVDDDFKIDLDRCRVVHTPTGCTYSFPEAALAGDLQLWQVVEVGKRARDVPDRGEIRKMAFDLYVAAAKKRATSHQTVPG